MNRSLPVLLSNLLLAASVSGCAAMLPANSQATQRDGQVAAPAQVCNAQSLAWTIGQAADDALIERARTASGAKSVRVLRPGMMVTQEFDATRLNIRVDNSHKVLSTRCG